MKLFWTLLLTAGLVAPAVAQEENTDDAPKTSEPAAKAEESPPADPAPTEPAPAATESPDSEKPASENPPPAQPDLTSEKGKTSYAIGTSIGRGLKNDGADIDPELVGRGLIDAFVEGEVQLTNEEIRAAIIAFKDKLRRDAQARYLDNNKTRLGVKTTESGLQYRVIAAGDGATPEQTDTVKVHYLGTLIDGTKFDSSYDSGEPSTFPVAGVIAGWTEALKLMNVGSHWEVVVPADLGYGENPRPGGKIKPGDALIFDMKLLGIEGQQVKPDEAKPDEAKPDEAKPDATKPKDDADKPADEATSDKAAPGKTKAAEDKPEE
ncbi:MAG: FKBP-type peptidyl-prolyl cis-trans isomerase [Pirellulales bacterium]